MRKSRIFVTGVAGFLGSHIAERLLARGHDVVGIDNLLGGEKENVPQGVEFYVLDCNNTKTVQDLMFGCEVVYHAAATAYEGLSVFSPHLVQEHILGASTGVFSAACAVRVKRIVHCSSMARYGAQNTPFREFMTPKPQDPYGIAKVAAEQMLKNLCEVHGVEYVIAVPHNIIGPRQKYDDPYRNVASIFLNLMLQKRPPTIYGDGEQKRCFSYVDDCLQCLLAMGFQPGLSSQIINIGPDEGPVTINQLWEICAQVTKFGGFPIRMPGRPQEVKNALCSSDKARQLLGYHTTVDLREGLENMAVDINRKGTKPFVYHLPIEILSPLTPKTWTEKLF